MKGKAERERERERERESFEEITRSRQFWVLGDISSFIILTNILVNI